MVNENLGVLYREIWIVKFQEWDLNDLNRFFLKNSVVIVTEYVDCFEEEKSTNGLCNNFNFFVQKNSSGRFFQCNFSTTEAEGVILSISHEHPFGYRDDNNPLYDEIVADYERVIKY